MNEKVKPIVRLTRRMSKQCTRRGTLVLQCQSLPANLNSQSQSWESGSRCHTAKSLSSFTFTSTEVTAEGALKLHHLRVEDPFESGD